jgi:hypothetical protein
LAALAVQFLIFIGVHRRPIWHKQGQATISSLHHFLQITPEAKMPNNVQEIVVTDVKIPFMSMVVLLVKWALAAIPAMVILIIIGMILSMIFGALFGGMYGWHGRM